MMQIAVLMILMTMAVVGSPHDDDDDDDDECVDLNEDDANMEMVACIIL